MVIRAYSIAVFLFLYVPIGIIFYSVSTQVVMPAIFKAYP